MPESDQHSNAATAADETPFAGRVDDAHVVTGYGPPHRTGFDGKELSVVRDHEIALGLTVEFVDRQAERLADIARKDKKPRSST